MDVFGVGLIVLFIMTAIFYIVLFSFLYYWHEIKISYIVVPVIFTFEFFAIGFFVVVLTSLFLVYIPELIKNFF